MRLQIILKPDKPLDLPIHYGTHLRGFFYNYLEPNISQYLHEHGYSVANKRYKMFCYSRLKGAYDIYHSKTHKQKRIVFKDEISFLISAIDADDIQEKQGLSRVDALFGFAQNLLGTNKAVELNDTACQVVGVTIVNTPRIAANKAVKIKMISPVSVHKTFKYSDNTKGSYFYYPFEAAWQEKIFANLENKAKALNWEDSKIPSESYIKPSFVLRTDKKIINDLGFWIEAWMGEYEVYLPENFLWLAYKAGLGVRNSAGLGMFEII